MDFLSNYQYIFTLPAWQRYLAYFYLQDHFDAVVNTTNPSKEPLHAFLKLKPEHHVILANLLRAKLIDAHHICKEGGEDFYRYFLTEKGVDIASSIIKHQDTKRENLINRNIQVGLFAFTVLYVISQFFMVVLQTLELKWNYYHKWSILIAYFIVMGFFTWEIIFISRKNGKQ